MPALYLISLNVHIVFFYLVILAGAYLNDATCLNKVTIFMNLFIQLVFVFFCYLPGDPGWLIGELIMPEMKNIIEKNVNSYKTYMF